MQRKTKEQLQKNGKITVVENNYNNETFKWSIVLLVNTYFLLNAILFPATKFSLVPIKKILFVFVKIKTTEQCEFLVCFSIHVHNNVVMVRVSYLVIGQVVCNKRVCFVFHMNCSNTKLDFLIAQQSLVERRSSRWHAKK